MEKRPYRRPAQYTKNTKRYRKDRSQEPPDTTRLGNQLSLSVLLCVFFIAIASIGGTTAQKIRSKASDLIGRNALDDFQAGDNLKDNISEFVRCMFSYGDDENIEDGQGSEVSEDEITKDMQNEKNDTSANDAALPQASSDGNDPTAASGSSGSLNGSASAASDGAASADPAPE